MAKHNFIKGLGWLSESGKTILVIDVGGSWTKFFLVENDKLTKKIIQPTHTSKLKSKIIKFNKQYPPQTLLIGMRGVWSAKDKKKWTNKLKGVAPRTKVLSDIELALHLNLGGQPGIVLSAGTGSVAMGQTQSGKVARAGGKGPHVGDEGSAYWIGKQVLNRTPLKGPKTLARVASLGYKNANFRTLQNQAQTHLIDLVFKVQSQLKLKPGFSVVLRGGLLENNTFRNSLIFNIFQENFKGIIQKSLF